MFLKVSLFPYANLILVEHICSEFILFQNSKCTYFIERMCCREHTACVALPLKQIAICE